MSEAAPAGARTADPTIRLQIATAATVRVKGLEYPDSPARFLRLVIAVSCCLRAGGNRAPDGDHSKLPFFGPRRRLAQRFCVKCTCGSLFPDRPEHLPEYRRARAGRILADLFLFLGDGQEQAVERFARDVVLQLRDR